MTDETAAVATPTDVKYLAPLAAVLQTVPRAEEDPTPRMMELVLDAEDPRQWEDLFDAESFKDHAGKKIRVQTFRWSPSKYKGRLGVFLIADIIWLDTGEVDVMTIGSELAMAALLNCWRRNDLPHDFEVVQKDTPTQAGFYPMRLRSLGKPPAPATGT